RLESAGQPVSYSDILQRRAAAAKDRRTNRAGPGEVICAWQMPDGIQDFQRWIAARPGFLSPAARPPALPWFDAVGAPTVCAARGAVFDRKSPRIPELFSGR